MDLFITKIRLKEEITKENIWDLICEWLINSPHYNISSIQYSFEDNFSQEFNSTKLDILNFTMQNESIFACRFTNNEKKNTWITDTIFIDNNIGKYISIRLSCENIKYSATLPSLHKPHIIKLLFDKDYCCTNECLPISDKPIYLDNEKLSLCSNIMTGTQATALPVVYLSYDNHNYKHYSLDPNTTSQQLSGIAHVLVEPNREFSLDLKKAAQCKNAFNGYIGVYFPNTDYREIISLDTFIKNGQIDQQSMSNEMGRIVRQALINHTNATDFTWTRLQLEFHKFKFNEKQLQLQKENENYQKVLSQTDANQHELQSIITALNEQLQLKDEELQSFMQEFDTENKDLKEKNDALRSQLDSKNAQMESLKQKSSNDVLSLAKNGLQDFFVDEIKDCVINILQQVKSKFLKENSRPFDIIENLIEANTISNHGKAIYRNIKSALNEKSLSERRKKLEKCGFDVTVGSHDKIYFHDPKFSTTLANSGSDYCETDNQYHDIMKNINIYIKL